MMVAAWNHKSSSHLPLSHPTVPDLNLHLPSPQARLDQSPHTLPGSWGCSWGQISDPGKIISLGDAEQMTTIHTYYPLVN